MQTKEVFLVGRKVGSYTILGKSFRVKQEWGYCYLTVVECDGRIDVKQTADINRELRRSLRKGRKKLHIRLRRIFSGMKQRCYNPKSKSYYLYGGRGIIISEEWKTAKRFVEWALVNGYRDDLTIDRINTYGNYSPDNCRWANWFVQNNNRRPRRRKCSGESASGVDG